MRIPAHFKGLNKKRDVGNVETRFPSRESDGRQRYKFSLRRQQGQRKLLLAMGYMTCMCSKAEGRIIWMRETRKRGQHGQRKVVIALRCGGESMGRNIGTG